MKSLQFFFCFAFFLICFSKVNAQQQVSSQIGVWGVSVTDTVVDPTIPHLSADKMSTTGSHGNSSTPTPPAERTTPVTDSVLILNTEKQIPTSSAPKK